MEKPLPDVPLPTIRPTQPRSGSSLTTLTIEGREHLRKFLLRLLEEEGSVTNRDEWVNALDEALRELGEAIAIGGWLAGLKRARKVRRESKKKDEEGQSVDEKPSTVKKADTSDAAEEDDVAEPTPSSSRRTSNEQASLRRNRLESLRVVLSKPTIPTPKPRIRHLLLTVAPYGIETAVFRSAEVSCKFTPDRFTLPSPEAVDDDMERVLYGLDEWTGAQ